MTAGHVRLVVGGEHGRGVLRLLEAAGDGLAQAGHLDPLLAGGVLGGDRRARDRPDGARGAGPARASGASRARSTSSFITRPSRPVPSTASGARPLSAISLLAEGASSTSRSAGGDRAPRRGGRGGDGRRAGLGGGAAGDAAELAAGLHGGAVLGVDLGEDAGGGRGHLDGDLVGLELAEHLVLGHRVADLLEPGRDGGLGDALAEGRDHDLDRLLVGRGGFRVVGGGLAGGSRRRPSRRAARRGGGRGGLAAAFSSMVARSASGPTVSPSLATISARTPAAGAGTSTVTLSVSSSQSISSTSTASPTFLNQVATVASVTLSPRAGTRIVGHGVSGPS